MLLYKHKEMSITLRVSDEQEVAFGFDKYMVEVRLHIAGTDKVHTVARHTTDDIAFAKRIFRCEMEELKEEMECPF